MNTTLKSALTPADMFVFDTCFMLHPLFSKKMPELIKASRFRLIPVSALEELRYLSENSGNMTTRTEAARLLRETELLRVNGVLSFFGDRSTVECADLSIIRYAATAGSGHGIAVFTQDTKLAEDIRRLNGLLCFEGTGRPPLSVYKINASGELVPFEAEEKKEVVTDAQTQAAKAILAKYGIVA